MQHHCVPVCCYCQTCPSQKKLDCQGPLELWWVETGKYCGSKTNQVLLNLHPFSCQLVAVAALSQPMCVFSFQGICTNPLHLIIFIRPGTEADSGKRRSTDLHRNFWCPYRELPDLVSIVSLCWKALKSLNCELWFL